MSDAKPVALVTGAGSGIGKAAAEALAAAGMQVVCADIREQGTTAAAIRAQGGAATAMTLDVRESVQWSAVVERTVAEHGAIRVLSNIAGVVSQGPDTAVEQIESEWQRVIDIDLKAVWLGMRSVLPTMIEAGQGRIINVASLAGLIGLPNLMTYSAAKGGVIGMSRQAAMQYAALGININVVCPGIIETPILGDITAEMRQAFLAATPVGRLGQPADVAATIAHLAGPGGDFITGQVLTVDGGWSAQ